MHATYLIVLPADLSLTPVSRLRYHYCWILQAQNGLLHFLAYGMRNTGTLLITQCDLSFDWQAPTAGLCRHFLSVCHVGLSRDTHPQRQQWTKPRL